MAPGNGGCKIRCGGGQERWIDGHKNECKSASDGGEEVGNISRMRKRPGIKEAPKSQWGDLIYDSQHWGYGT